MSQHRVFVYGTLKVNEPNHHVLTDQTNGRGRLLGHATMQERHPLVIASRYNIPYLLPAPGQGEHVRGEVYEVDDVMLKKLDSLEDHPKYYERKVLTVQLEDPKEDVECWVYLLFGFKPHLMELPFLKEYSARQDPEKQYTERFARPVGGSEYWTDVKLDDWMTNK